MKWEERKLKLFRGNAIFIQTVAAEFEPVEAVEVKKFVRGTKGPAVYKKRKALRFITLQEC